jgi:hypothetical protein
MTKHIRKRGNFWIVIDLNDNTIKTCNSKEEAIAVKAGVPFEEPEEEWAFEESKKEDSLNVWTTGFLVPDDG